MFEDVWFENFKFIENQRKILENFTKIKQGVNSLLGVLPTPYGVGLPPSHTYIRHSILRAGPYVCQGGPLVHLSPCPSLMAPQSEWKKNQTKEKIQ